MCLYNDFAKLRDVHARRSAEERRLPSCLLLVTQDGTAAGPAVLSKDFFFLHLFPILKDCVSHLTCCYTSFLGFHRPVRQLDLTADVIWALSD